MEQLTTNASEIMRELGVVDLPFAVKSKFALALKAERMGDDVKAAEYLEAAIANEAKK